ncbi:MAG: peptidoglycan DD-metalloendopeptidase family protein [Bacillota bacterium]
MKKILISFLLISVLFIMSTILGSIDNSNIETQNIGGSRDNLFGEKFKIHNLSNISNQQEEIKKEVENLLAENEGKSINKTSGQLNENNFEEDNSITTNSSQIAENKSHNDKDSLDKNIPLVNKITEHRVKNGENLWTIAQKYNIDIDTIIGANDITNMNRIQKNDILKILPEKGIIYKINPGENLWTISRQFDIAIDKITKANDISNPDLVKPGAVLVLPGVTPEFSYKERLNDNFIQPVNGRISSNFGMRWGSKHEGIDFAVNTGTKIKAAKAGRIIYSDWASGYGHTVIIEHRKGVRTLYGHNSKLLVQGGQYVERGEVIALSGNSGRSTGPHLHFEIQINGKPVDPLPYIN